MERTLYFAAIFTKCILYLCLFVLFLDFYFIKQCQDFIKGKTTFSTSFERKEDAKIPNFLLCPYPGYKESLLKFNNLSEPYLALYKSSGYNEDMYEVYKNFTYVLGTDYTLSFAHKYNDDPTVLKDGEQFFFGESFFKVSLVPTFKNGMCVLLKTNFTVKKFVAREGRPNAFLIDIPNDHEEPPYGFSLYFTDDQSWHEIIYDEWRYTKPSKFHLYTNFDNPKKGKFHIFGLANTKQITHMNGIRNRKECIRKLHFTSATKKNCSVVCNPIIFSFLSDIKMCQNVEDFICNIGQFGPLETDIHECLRPESTTEYVADYSIVNLDENSGVSVGFNFRYISQRLEVQEEKFVISSRNFIGSVGGSLGLFLGFSMFHYSSVVIDGLFKRISKALQPLQQNMINISLEA